MSYSAKQFKKVGEGWQYVVYDMGNGRILKKFKSPLRRFLYIYLSSNESLLSSWREMKRMEVEATESFRILMEKDIPKELIGNPEFGPNFDYTQDKVTSIKGVLDKSTVKKRKEIVDKFIEFNHKILKLGFIDLSFRMGANFGINKDGEVVLSDIGEIVVDPERIRKQRKARYWYMDYVNTDIKNVIREVQPPGILIPLK
jgi:hypothetical protein